MSAFASDLLTRAAKVRLLSGEMVNYTRRGGSGKDVVFFTCSRCPTVLWSECGAFPGMKVLKVGTLDDAGAQNACKPVGEIFTANRVAWCGSLNGAAQYEQSF